MPIPKSVTQADLLVALKPLCDLLGTNVNSFYEVPGITIGNGRVTFIAPVRHEEIRGREAGYRPRGTRADRTDYVHPQGDPFAELCFVVDVEVTRPTKARRKTWRDWFKRGAK